MSLQETRQPLAASGEDATRALDRPDRVFDFRGPLFRTDEAAAYLHYRGRNALRSLYRFLKAKGVPTSRRFRTLLIKKADLDRALSASPSQRHRSAV